MNIEIRSKVAHFGPERMVIEVPKAVRDNFKPGDKVIIRLAEG